MLCLYITHTTSSFGVALIEGPISEVQITLTSFLQNIHSKYQFKSENSLNQKTLQVYLIKKMLYINVADNNLSR